INHVLLDGQLHGGIAQGIGQVMGERAVYDESSGQLLTGTFMDYEMPRADGMPQIRLYDRSIPSPGNPLGVKGAGEAGTTGAVPAVANAVIDALRPLGIDTLDLPYTPDRVWRAIRGAQCAAAPPRHRGAPRRERFELARGDLARKRHHAAVGAGIELLSRHELHRRAQGARDVLGRLHRVARDVDRADHDVLALEKG